MATVPWRRVLGDECEGNLAAAAGVGGEEDEGGGGGVIWKLRNERFVRDVFD